MQKKVLLIDDDPISLRVLSNYLHADKNDVVTAENGEQAWEILKDHPADFFLIIADRIMPKLHAIDLLKRIRTVQELKNTPFIIVTGFADEEDITEAKALGAFDFLYKPIEIKSFLSVIKRAKSLST